MYIAYQYEAWMGLLLDEYILVGSWWFLIANVCTKVRFKQKIQTRSDFHRLNNRPFASISLSQSQKFTSGQRVE